MCNNNNKPQYDDTYDHDEFVHYLGYLINDISGQQCVVFDPPSIDYPLSLHCLQFTSFRIKEPLFLYAVLTNTYDEMIASLESKYTDIDKGPLLDEYKRLYEQSNCEYQNEADMISSLPRRYSRLAHGACSKKYINAMNEWLSVQDDTCKFVPRAGGAPIPDWVRKKIHAEKKTRIAELEDIHDRSENNIC